MHITRLGTLQTQLGECPLWDAAQQQLWFMDCRQGLLYRLDPATGQSTEPLALPAPTGSMAFTADGRLVVALKRTVVCLDPATGATQTLATLDIDHPDVRLNDGVATPDGGFLVGTMHINRTAGEPPLGGLYRLDASADGTPNWRHLAGDIGVTNGPRFGPAAGPHAGRFYVCDSAARRIDVFTVAADGSLTERRPFVDTTALDSAPDGCAFDDAGGLWTALVHQGALVRFDADGQVSARIELPLTHPTALCFGGPDLSDIFVTSISDSGRLRADGPMEGAVLRVQGSGYRGVPLPVCQLPG